MSARGMVAAVLGMAMSGLHLPSSKKSHKASPMLAPMPSISEKLIGRARAKRVRKGMIRLATWTGARRTTRGTTKRVRNG